MLEVMVMTNELYEKLTSLQWLLHKQQMHIWAENGPMADRTRGQGRVLAVLKLQDGISTKDLSYLLGVRVSSLNELLVKLEKGGYVIREPSEEDKRVMLVKLTERGRNEQQSEPFDVDDIFSCLSDEEQEIFGEYLDRIIAAFYANVSDGDDEMFKKIEALRAKFSKFDEMGGFFKEHGRDFFGERGFSHQQMGHGHGHIRHGDFFGSHGFRGHGKDKDKEVKGDEIRDDRN